MFLRNWYSAYSFGSSVIDICLLVRIYLNNQANTNNKANLMILVTDTLYCTYYISLFYGIFFVSIPLTSIHKCFAALCAIVLPCNAMFNSFVVIKIFFGDKWLATFITYKKILKNFFILNMNNKFIFQTNNYIGTCVKIT